MKTQGPPQETDRVRLRTPAAVNERIDFSAARRVEECAAKPHVAIGCDITALDGEWDIERALLAGLAGLTVPGLALAAVTGRRGWLALPATAAALAFDYVVRGWCAPVGLLRRFGIRTRREIDGEKFALKSLRGDFDAISSTHSLVARAGSAMQAVAH